jgi:hypothetical protein
MGVGGELREGMVLGFDVRWSSKLLEEALVSLLASRLLEIDGTPGTLACL